MTIAFFSDIHANLPALQSVLEDIERRKPDMTFCLGDLVGYAPWPNEVVGEIRARGIPTIAGNYDEGVGINSDDCGCAYKSEQDKTRGAESIAWTNKAVSNETRAYLRALPRHLSLEFQSPEQKPFRLLMVHGSPRKINEYLFEERPDQSFVRMMEGAGCQVLLFGHTHKPFHKVLHVQAGAAKEGEESKAHYLHAINIGSVGKPKDGDPRSCYLLLHIADAPSALNPESVRAEFVRVPYNVEQAAAAIERSSLPDHFADMLRNAY